MNNLCATRPRDSLDLEQAISSIVTVINFAERPTSRIVLLNERDEVLLICYRDLSSTASSASRLWVTPGGLEVEESYEDAARRELLEETGIVVSEVGRPIWMRNKVVDSALFLERHFLVRCADVDLVTENNSDLNEHNLTLEVRWWSLEDLQISTETIYPEDLALHLEPVLRGVIPATPIDITRADLEQQTHQFAAQ